MTTVNFEGKKVELTQEAYVISATQYQAHGVMDGEDVLVTWDIENFETENEDETCDWSSPVSVEAV